MKIFLIAFISMSFASVSEWQPDYPTAMQLAKQENRLLLLNFSGSDWCIPCIRMKREIFTDSVLFSSAGTSVVLYNADFPRKKKNELSATFKKQNEDLAEKYNPGGKFPFTVLLDTAGRVVKSWDGYPAEGREEFVQTVQKSGDEYHKQ